jgi:hypothetical protein
VVGSSRDLVTLSESEAALPSAGSLELRAPGLWTEIGIQTPWEHVTVDLEAFAVRLDDPDDVFGRAYGDRVALGCELEWETAAPIEAHESAASSLGYSLACNVHGELLVADEVIEIDGWGWRSHRWGSASTTELIRGRRQGGDWWTEPHGRISGVSTIGRAPIAEQIAHNGLAFDRRLVETAAGDLAWIRSSVAR